MSVHFVTYSDRHGRDRGPKRRTEELRRALARARLHEPRIRFGDETRVPDLAGWRADRFVAPQTGPYMVMPDWICEALSPGTARTDRTEKMPLYARHGVGHLWLLDPVLQTLEVYRLESGRWIGNYGGDAKIRAEPFDAVELDLTLVWGPKREPEGP